MLCLMYAGASFTMQINPARMEYEQQHQQQEEEEELDLSELWSPALRATTSPRPFESFIYGSSVNRQRQPQDQPSRRSYLSAMQLRAVAPTRLSGRSWRDNWGPILGANEFDAETFRFIQEIGRARSA